MVDGGNKCIKWLIFIFNFIFFLTGCGLIGLGIWLNVDQDDWEGISDFNYISVANVAIAAGVIIVLVSFLGCCGAITENKFMLLGFFIFLLIIFILEIAAGIAAYVMRGNVESELKKQLDDRIPERYGEVGIRNAMDAIQKEFKCCGVNNISDWRSGSPPKIPKSCCKPAVTSCDEVNFDGSETLSNYFQKGCFKSIENFLEDNLLYVGITGIIFAIFQLVGMVFAMILYCAISKESQTA